VELIAGFRRIAAAEAAGLDYIPAVVPDPVAGMQRISDQVAENDDRCALTELDAAGAMQQMLELGATTDAVAQRFPRAPTRSNPWCAVPALPAPLLAFGARWHGRDQ
jgi:ParB family chromosome partitioning protein